jgi:hypothetical protein
MGRLAALLILALALFAGSAPLSAQDSRCVCDHYTIRVDGAVGCPVTFCWTFSEEGPVFCQTINPGSTFSVPCPLWAGYVQYCNGSYQAIGNAAGSLCSPTLTITPGCCVTACWFTDRAGCPGINIMPALCVAPGCP